jgi:F0F1-type ATP synthase membrane subunit b/b'
MGDWITLIIVVAVTIGLFLLLRSLVLWYFKLDQIAGLLDNIAQNAQATARNTKAVSDRLDALLEEAKKQNAP